MGAIKKCQNEKSEAVFHDHWANSIDINTIEISKYFESAFSPENQQIIQWMGDIKGKTVLDLGCGAGEAAVYFAIKGAKVTAADISFGMLKKANELAKQHKTSIEVRVCSATDLSTFANESFDIIYAANLLHHVDIKQCLLEIHKKLKPNGTAYFWDPVLYNPAIQLYRFLASNVRTENEHPLTTSDISTMKQVFYKVEIKHHWLLSLSIFFKYFFIDRIHPSKSRYWKMIFDESPSTEAIVGVLHKIDTKIFKILPILKWLSWNVSIRLKK